MSVAQLVWDGLCVSLLLMFKGLFKTLTLSNSKNHV